MKNAVGLFDINRISEDFYIPILSILFNCDDLVNQNRIQHNFPAVDLGSNNTRQSFQVSSDASSAKIIETIKKFKSHKLYEDFDSLNILLLTQKQNQYRSRLLEKEIENLSIDFDIEKNVLDPFDLLKKIDGLPTQQIKQISDYLEVEFNKVDESLKFKSELSNFIAVATQKIEVEKNTKKYIPAVFVETSETKDDVRLFANPIFFFGRIPEMVSRLDFEGFNKRLSQSKITPLDFSEAESFLEASPSSFEEAQAYLNRLKTKLGVWKEKSRPFSWVREEEGFRPSSEQDAHWETFRLAIQSRGSGLVSQIEKIEKAISLIEAKIFLVTGMAGQGKTNFLCDLVENQFAAFQIPTIFIAARYLNNFPTQRIVSYIKSNRYAPKVNNLDDLLKLMNDIAEESGKPFVIVIDGINEVGDLVGFNAELTQFLNSNCQYEFIKAIITCRSEFFDRRFSSLLNEPFASDIYHLTDLRSKMSQVNRQHLLRGYFEFFGISLTLSENSMHFLENDLILLRLFCEVYKGTKSNRLVAVNKGEIFEAYLLQIANEFPEDLRKHLLPTLYSIARQMLNAEEFANADLKGASEDESRVIAKLVGEDIVLRRELPLECLDNLGGEAFSFTYDEMRDFIISRYLVKEVSGTDLGTLESVFENLTGLPIEEGVFRYSYLIARDTDNKEVISICEKDEKFDRHYIYNLNLLSPTLQKESDAERIRGYLSTLTRVDLLRRVCVYLWHRKDLSDHLNLSLLAEHIQTLDEANCMSFFEKMFEKNVWDSGRRHHISQLNSVLDSVLEQEDSVILKANVYKIALFIQMSSCALWDVREAFKNRMSTLAKEQLIMEAIQIASGGHSDAIKSICKEIVAG